MLVSRGPMDPPPDADLIVRARAERVHLLLAARLGVTRDHAAGLADDVAARLVAEIRVAAVEETVRARELVRVVERLESRGCAPVVFKGAALAYTHYERPWLRPRVDVDVLVDEAQRHEASRAFPELGYTRPPFVSGELVMYQEPFVRAEPGGLEHVFDLHWRVANPQAVSRVLSHQELLARAIVADVPGGRLRVPCPADALVLACVHRAAHHQDAQNLLWLFDIHLVASRLTDDEWRAVVATARAGKVTALCARGLGLAADRFGTGVPASVRAALRNAAPDEPSAVFLQPALTPAARLVSDLRALGAGDRLRLLRETVVPPRAYMRAVHGDRGWLPWLYVRRVVTGARKWLTPVRRGR
jgi:hypothetical protein